MKNQMDRLRLPKPVSAGIILSYKCSSTCKHCMYACSPKWRADWPTEGSIKLILGKLASSIKPSPHGPENISLNHGLHFTGGEPFLNFKLLLNAVETAEELRIPSTFVETNCFWCINDEQVEEKLMALKQAGLKGILVSVNPFILEQVPFERVERAVKTGGKIFGANMTIYQETYYRRFKSLRIRDTLTLDQYLEKDKWALHHSELLPMGRACYRLNHLFVKYPAKAFFREQCISELTRSWHIHVDNYFNYVPGYCGGISLGDARNLNALTQGIDLQDKPVLRMLVESIGNLYEFASREFNYKEKEEGYISKCHLCVDIRRHIAQQTDEFKELQPRELYSHLE
ncbi:MAG: 4Fe-4S cluster-binding domain-containing protein [Candidatus Brockarchaeota archaeon]|nr:4Fe-4S cluster-binding domain-containing protein [Candidatus Brockarchaeota archaeon]